MDWTKAFNELLEYAAAVRHKARYPCCPLPSLVLMVAAFAANFFVDALDFVVIWFTNNDWEFWMRKSLYIFF